ncbi:MAG: hypothetical protein U5N26_08945 [Candidatus Marinimicrobia bacterium]|nr:hypothetical protein [Candidatus Neomarinimicrobiota bacterium]
MVRGKKGMAAMYLGLEAAFIGGSLYFTRRGNLEVDNYEDFADAHWSVVNWLDHYDPSRYQHIWPTVYRRQTGHAAAG